MLLIMISGEYSFLHNGGSKIETIKWRKEFVGSESSHTLLFHLFSLSLFVFLAIMSKVTGGDPVQDRQFYYFLSYLLFCGVASVTCKIL